MDGDRGEPGPSLSLAKLSVLALGGVREFDDTADTGVSGRAGVAGDLGKAERGVDGAAEAGVAGVVGVTGVTGIGNLGRTEVGVGPADIGVTGVLGSKILWVTFLPYLISERDLLAAICFTLSGAD